MFQKLFLGPLDKAENQGLSDLSAREILTLAPILALIFWIGLYPRPFFDLMAPSVGKVIDLVNTAAIAMR
jgi:NADH-quinone oxidoreductase subunit M